MLPKKLSQLGPGVAWGDLDGDGWDDLIIGSGKGGRLAAYRNTGQGGFTRLTGKAFERVEARDLTAVLLWHGNDQETRMLAGSTSYEESSKPGVSVLASDPKTGRVEDIAADAEWSVGPLALGDIYGEGTLCLFVEGRVIPGRYPEPASSRIYRNRNGKFELDADNTRVLDQVGLVSGAVFSDLDGDGFPELILACEWGPLKIFRNDRSRLAVWDAPVTTLNSQLSTLNSQPINWLVEQCVGCRP